MKVLFIFHDSDIYSGGTRSMLDVVDGLNDNPQFQCCALFPNAEGTAKTYLEKKGIETYYYKYHQIKYMLDEGIKKRILRFPDRLIDLFQSIINSFTFAGTLQDKKIDVIYTNTSVLINGVIFKRRNKNIIHFWHLREFCEEDHRIGIFIGRKIYYKLLNKYTDHVIVISDALKNKYRDYVVTPPISVIYDDVSNQYLINKHLVYQKGDVLKVLIAGMICEGKGQFQVVQAVNESLKKGLNIELYIAGRETDQGYVKKIKDYCKERNIESKVHFMGLVTDINKLRQNIHVGVVASKSEAFGRVTIEGMLSGLLMIGANQASTKELIDDGVTGLLYEYGNADSLANIFVEIANNPPKMERIRQSGKLYAKKFTNNNAAIEIKHLLEKEVK